MKKCRACSEPLNDLVVSLGVSPLANSYLSEDSLNRMEPFYPLDVYVCKQCLLVQLEEYETAKNIFSDDYAYFSSYSDSWLKHCQEYVELMVKRFGFNEKSKVVEIASNDGYLLQYFVKKNIPVLGVEPTANTAKVAREKGIPTDVTFFNTEYAARLADQGGQADLIIGNNVLAHNPNLNDFVKGLKVALKPAGIITMEFPHLLRLIEENQFDTIYHEHYSYFSLHSVRKLFNSHDLELFDVEEIPTHGGSLRIYGRHLADNSRAVSDNTAKLIDKEKAAGLLDLRTYHDYGEKVRKTKRALLKFLGQAKKEGKRIAGYGAPAKGNTLLNYCGIRTDYIDFTVDRSPHKQGKFLPGTHIPIYEPNSIKEKRPDYVLILPWNIKEEIMEQMSFIRDWGGKFVVPIPEVKVLD